MQPTERIYSVLRGNERNLTSTGIENIHNYNAPRNRNVMAIRIRDSFATYFETSNPLDWQWKKALNNEY